MTITTQDGRKLKLSRKFRLEMWARKIDDTHKLFVRLEDEPTQVPSVIRYEDKYGLHEIPSFYWDRNVILEESVGDYHSEIAAIKAAELLSAAWKNGATEFIIPQHNFKFSLTPTEAFDEFCKEHHLTCVAVNELGYSPQDTARNAHIWKSSDEFERRNILIADEDADCNEFGGVYSTSLKKWQALQERSTAS